MVLPKHELVLDGSQERLGADLLAHEAALQVVQRRVVELLKVLACAEQSRYEHLAEFLAELAYVVHAEDRNREAEWLLGTRKF